MRKVASPREKRVIKKESREGHENFASQGSLNQNMLSHKYRLPSVTKEKSLVLCMLYVIQYSHESVWVK